MKEVIRLLNGLTVRELQRFHFRILWLLIGLGVIPNTRARRKKYIDRFLHLTRNVELHLRISPEKIKFIWSVFL